MPTALHALPATRAGSVQVATIECRSAGLHTADHVGCAACPAGLMPNPARSSCVPCPDGQAGQGGVCEQCPLGTQPRIDAASRAVIADSCTACTNTSIFNSTRGWVSGTGTTCATCPAGRSPNAEHTVCDVCPPGKFSVVGRDCQYCPHGQEPNTIMFDIGATHCIVCVNGTHQHNDDTCLT